LSTLQRYQVRVGDAFAVVGERNGFLHNRIRADSGTGCIDNPVPNPLFTGRIPLRPPPCTGDGLTAFEPNPCSTTVEQIERFVPFEVDSDVCVAEAETLRTRSAAAVRFSNPVFTFHMVDTEATGDLECRGDRAGMLPPFSTVHPGYQFSMLIASGFLPMFLQMPQTVDPAFPISSVEGPDGLIWVLDQGDQSSTTKGQVIVFDPDQATNGFGVVPIL
jgi:hypothetical protein